MDFWSFNFSLVWPGSVVEARASDIKLHDKHTSKVDRLHPGAPWNCLEKLLIPERRAKINTWAPRCKVKPRKCSMKGQTEQWKGNMQPLDRVSGLLLVSSVPFLPFSPVITPPCLPFLPYPSRRSVERCHCQMTQSCRQTQTADSGGKGLYKDSHCKAAGICAGGGRGRRTGGGRLKRTVQWEGVEVWMWDKEDRLGGGGGELFISGTLLQFHPGMMEISRIAKPRVEGVW